MVDILGGMFGAVFISFVGFLAYGYSKQWYDFYLKTSPENPPRFEWSNYYDRLFKAAGITFMIFGSLSLIYTIFELISLLTK